MELRQSPKTAQRQILSQGLQQSLQCLQLPLAELGPFLQEQALSNPLLEVELPEHPAAVFFGDLPGYGGGRTETAPAQPESAADYLAQQVNCMPGVDHRTRSLCLFLIGCLDSGGYLACPLGELAAEFSIPLYDLEQGLYLLQMLDPAGVGARDLSECLLLQLAQGPDFQPLHVRMVREGLPLLARRDYAALAAAMGVGVKDIRRSEAVIKALNPVPLSGFYSGAEPGHFVVPEAFVSRRGEGLLVELNRRSLPRLRLSEEYCAMLSGGGSDDVQAYLKERLAAARHLIAQLRDRQNTLLRLLEEILRRQEGHFLRGEACRPMTMQAVAQALGLSVSTVSRGVRDKYIQYEDRTLALRSLFSAPLPGPGEGRSADSARASIRLFIQKEDPAAPLTDEDLAQALSQAGIAVSRRTAAKYRLSLGIPSAAQRRRSK